MDNIEFNSKILIVSDVHLGALKNELELFQDFLNDINSGEFGKDLQAVIILGDFFDLITENPKTLLNNNQILKILKSLRTIQQEKNLIFVLGNHEIPVIGNYDKRFNSRKTRFLKKFRIGILDDLFNEKIFCQYIILNKFKKRDSLLLFDSTKDIFDNPINRIKIRGLDLDNNYQCIMAHGYQFDDELFRFLVGSIWRLLIQSEDIALKRSFDFLWNEIIKGNLRVKDSEFDVMIQQLPQLKKLDPNIIEGDFSRYGSYDFALIKLIMRVLEKWEKKRKYDYYVDGIKDFLRDNNQYLTNINHIIYGHSHNWKISEEIVGDREITIINDGAWQHVKPSYVQIFYKGEIKVNQIPTVIV